MIIAGRAIANIPFMICPSGLRYLSPEGTSLFFLKCNKKLRLHDFRIIQREPSKIISFDVVIPDAVKEEPSSYVNRIKEAIKLWEPGIEAEITADRLFVKATG